MSKKKKKRPGGGGSGPTPTVAAAEERADDQRGEAPKPKPKPKPKPSAAPAVSHVKKMDMGQVAKSAMAGFGFSGAVLGLLTGLNHVPVPPDNLQSPFSVAAWTGGAYGLQGLDWSTGYVSGAAGLLIGLAVGYSFQYPAGRMMRSWVLGTAGLIAGLLTNPASPVLAAAGCLVGFIAGSFSITPKG